MTITVVIADDEELVRTGLRMILSAEPDLEVLAEAVDGADAVQLVAEHSPDVLLLDIRMPVLDGLAAMRELQPADTRTSVVILTTFDADANVHEALAAGPAGFCSRMLPQGSWSRRFGPPRPGTPCWPGRSREKLPRSSPVAPLV